jgi:phenylacetic acid degradation operon negative regulatory protein
MSRRPQVRTQFLIFTLFGDYVYPREGWAWTGSLITLLKLLGVSNQAARSTLSRMSKQGWLKVQRKGRNSLYALTLKGQHLLEEGAQRIFEPRRQGWDGKWRVVVYSLPEKKRDLREALRRRLSWLGFGPLSPGTWVSPHDRQVELEALLDDLNVRHYVQCFVGQWLNHLSNDDLVQRCWNLTDLNRRYAAFLRKWEPELQNCEVQQSGGNPLTPSECFVRRFWIVHEYSAFPRSDPNLPAELLPEGWLGDEAARVFRDYRELLNERANAFIEQTLQNENGPVG